MGGIPLGFFRHSCRELLLDSSPVSNQRKGQGAFFWCAFAEVTMRSETIAIHAGYEPDPTTKSVAVPIYQTAAYAVDSADHGAAVFNLETEGFRYSRISNPT